MTDTQKIRIERMRKNGMEFSEIAEATGTSVDSVRMHCKRMGIEPARDKVDCCLSCGAPLVRKGAGRKPIYCSETCRVRGWYAIRRSTGKGCVTIKCANCGKEFFALSNDRKYCSHECYILGRFGGADNDAE